MHLNLTYGDHHRQKLDLYLPSETSAQHGVVVYFYGGTWSKGDRRIYRFLATLLNARGYAVVIPDYRIYPEVRYPYFMEDAALVLHWLEKRARRYNLDMSSLFIMGHSAGAHMGALLLTNRRFLDEQDFAIDKVSGFIGLAGPYSFNPLEYDSTQDIFRTALPVEDAQPIKHVHGQEPPMLLLHGHRDSTVYPRNTREFANAVNAAGGTARHKIYPGVGHVGILTAILPPLRWRAPVLKDMIRFLDSHSQHDENQSVICL